MIVWNTNQYAVTPYKSALDSITSGLTVCCKCRRTADAALMMIASRQTSAAPSNEWWGLTLQNNIPRALVGNASSVVSAQGTAVMPLNTDVFYLMTWDGATITLKQDGAVLATAARTGALSADTTPIVLNGNAGGAGGTSISEFFIGRVEDIRVYNRALSDAEQACIQRSSGNDGIVQGLVAWYPLNEGPDNSVPTVLRDVSGNGLDGTVVGSPTWYSGTFKQKCMVL